MEWFRSTLPFTLNWKRCVIMPAKNLQLSSVEEVRLDIFSNQILNHLCVAIVYLKINTQTEPTYIYRTSINCNATIPLNLKWCFVIIQWIRHTGTFIFHSFFFPIYFCKENKESSTCTQHIEKVEINQYKGYLNSTLKNLLVANLVWLNFLCWKV